MTWAVAANMPAEKLITREGKREEEREGDRRGPPSSFDQLDTCRGHPWR